MQSYPWAQAGLCTLGLAVRMFSVKAQHRNNTLQKVLCYRGNIVDSRDFAPTCVESEDLNPAVFIDSLFFNGHGGGLNT